MSFNNDTKSELFFISIKLKIISKIISDKNLLHLISFSFMLLLNSFFLFLLLAFFGLLSFFLIVTSSSIKLILKRIFEYKK